MPPQQSQDLETRFGAPAKWCELLDLKIHKRKDCQTDHPDPKRPCGYLGNHLTRLDFILVKMDKNSTTDSFCFLSGKCYAFSTLSNQRAMVRKCDHLAMA
ncbi:unnamed protein product [Pipistrellus nathusii]|uniref:Uncharacterized protein n=1 Tax=Pipistrellus nathusii TaxID=59473 RepID=A0ABN9ZA61_PIPNA